MNLELDNEILIAVMGAIPDCDTPLCEHCANKVVFPDGKGGYVEKCIKRIAPCEGFIPRTGQ